MLRTILKAAAKKAERRNVFNNSLFFVHIPKTAGTSFREGLEHALKPHGELLFDYGSTVPKTSAMVSDCYESGDIWRVGRLLTEGSPTCITGHVPARKYMRFVGCANTLTILRDPTQRVISEWEHARRVNGYSKPFEHFYRKPSNQNKQARLLCGFPWEAMGFVGITEHYQQSLALIRHVYGIDVEFRKSNVARRDLNLAHDIQPDVFEELQSLNENDIRLYKRGVEVFEERLSYAEAGKPFVHGRVTALDAQAVAGWAWYGMQGGQVTDDPVELEILVNGEVSARCRSVDFRESLCFAQPPRAGFVGFRVSHGGKAGDVIAVRVAETGQQVFSEVLKAH